MNTPEKEMVQQEHLPLADRIAALVQLGLVMSSVGDGKEWPGHGIGLVQAEYETLDALVRTAQLGNGWFTEENVRHAFSAWGNALTKDGLERWLGAYPELGAGPRTELTVGLILAGNVPLVGLHDVICTWLSGHGMRVKCSAQDAQLVPALMEVLQRFVPGGRGSGSQPQIVFTSNRLGEVDAIIATGSNNTARYFEHYFGHLPRIVRKSRVSVAVLDGSETEEELASLAEDVFRYFGLGCRNVAKVYLPMDFDLDRLFGAFFPWKEIVNHNKYGNNYDYTRALWMLDGVPFLENGFILLREASAMPSAMATLHYERYSDRSSVEAELDANKEGIQCIVGHGHLPFGTAQQPALDDYADGVDPLRFLIGLQRS